MSDPDVPKKRGRPTNKALAANKQGGKKGQVGRPKGDAAIINEYKSRMLSSPKSVKVLESIYAAALNDEHKNQASAWKLILDRVAPLSYYEKDQKTGGRNSISISITGVGGETSIVGGPRDPIDGDYEDV